MNHRLNVIVNGKPYTIEVADLSTSPLTVHVNGRAYSVEISGANEVGEQENVSSKDVTAVRHLSITAPMPGKIMNISIQTGDTVDVGDVLCTLEAMKMQNAIRSPRFGVIAHVAVKTGQTVNYGDVLVTFLD